jgi:hypothetical protein
MEISRTEVVGAVSGVEGLCRSRSEGGGVWPSVGG